MGLARAIADLEKLSTAALPATTGGQRWAEPIVARLATEFWRLRRRVQTSGDPVAPSVQDSVTRIADVFAEHDVYAVDHDGELYNPDSRSRCFTNDRAMARSSFWRPCVQRSHSRAASSSTARLSSDPGTT